MEMFITKYIVIKNSSDDVVITLWTTKSFICKSVYSKKIFVSSNLHKINLEYTYNDFFVICQRYSTVHNTPTIYNLLSFMFILID